MFWIHGGGFSGGGSNEPRHNGDFLPLKGVVLVTINYRLGVFGFLAHPALTAESPHRSSGNYGLMDQLLALHWVRDNIARFGGDPANITVFGQSAGSMDTGILMTSPLAAGFFQKAIAESGAAFAPPVAPLAAAEQFGLEAAALFNVPAGAEGIAALRRIAAPDLLARLGDHASQWPGFSPDVDGWVLPRSPEAVFAAGGEAAIPLLIGTTSREFGNSEPLDALHNAITQTDADYASQALALYGLADGARGASDPLYGPAAVQWNADNLFHCPIATEALWHFSAHNATFEYEFDHAIPGQEAQGALHSSDLPYVFGFFPRSGNIGGSFSDADKRLADLMESYWANFGKTGDPNGTDLVFWPELGRKQSFLRFTQEGTAVVSHTPLRGAQCDVYRKVAAEKLKIADVPAK
jgi:para-nitrobenzyl esterase